MKLIFAPDSFKGSLAALDACRILERTARRHFPESETVSIPAADGGEGTVDAMLYAAGGTVVETPVTDPLFERVIAKWGLLADGETAVIEMAQASGLPYVPENRRDPRWTTSFGTGELMAEALRRGARRLLVGIGGSATNDGGIGMLQALGAVFTDDTGNAVRPVGGALKSIVRADLSHLLPELKEARITVICDVTNRLLGESGATLVYGPQKGATPEICRELETGMAHYAQIMGEAVGRDIAGFPGAGAAGGLGAALGGVLDAALKNGIDAVLDAADFDTRLEGASLVITGEGQIDSQSLRYGKVPAGVAKRCAAKGVPVAVLVGGIGAGAEALFELMPQSTVLSVMPGPMSLACAMENAAQLYETAADRLFRTLRIGMLL